MKGFLKYMILLCVLIAGCEKVELPEPILDDPIFMASGLVDGEAFDFQAGVEEYYLFTDVVNDSVTNIPVYRGSLKDINNCADPCPNSLSIEFRNDSIGITSIEDLLAEGEKEVVGSGVL